jgi:hypothetical protein
MNQVDRISELLYQVPRPPEDSIPPGVCTEQLAQFEGRTGIKLPAMLRRWLTLTNAPCIGPGGFYGIHPTRSHLDIEEYLRQFPEWRGRKWIPVAGDGCGNQYIIPTQNEFGLGYPVMFVDMGQTIASPAYIVASDLEHFIVAILQNELGATGWPFNRNQLLTFDPLIMNYHGIPFPWAEKRAEKQ